MPSRPRSRSHTCSPIRSVSPRSRSPTPPRRRATPSRGRSYSRSPTPRAASPNPRSAKIVIEALTRNVGPDHIREIFGQYGAIQDVRMPMHPTFHINRGIAYVLYQHADDAERAIAKMHDAQLDGAKLHVSLVLPRRRFSRTPPPARKESPPHERAHYDSYAYGPARQGRGFGGPPGAYRPPPMDAPGRYRSPPPRWSPERGGHWTRGRGGRGGRQGSGFVRPRSYSRSRSRSPRRSRSRSSFSPSPSPPPRRHGRGGGERGGHPKRDTSPYRGERNGGGGGRRSPSYSSYGSGSPQYRSRSSDRR